MVLFAVQHLFPFPFREVAQGIWHKYPNEHTPHITSVDVIDRSFLPDGTLRTERLISITQNAPRWIMSIIGSAEQQFVREVIFLKPPSAPDQMPKVLMWSVNLSMASILICREKIRYEPHSDSSTLFTQRADIEAQGSLGPGQSYQRLGHRLELWARDRFSSNAVIGRQGFQSVLNSLYGHQTSNRDPQS